jgi:UDP:flavonoid glycosyltransferase YjiC (YdhE family)
LQLRALNRLTHSVSKKITWWTSSFGFKQVRRRAGLPKRKLYFPFDKDPLRSPTPILCAWSPSILPSSRDWGENVHVTGYYFLDVDESYQPSIDLQNFLDAGESPICVTFGSMLNRDAARIDNIVRDALRRTNNRGIILSGWGIASNQESDNLIYFDAVPHEWLLPRCKMIVHHGGAGTTSAGLRAGIPNVVVPFTTDQPFWGRQVHAVGAGPKPILVNKLSTENLTRAIIDAEDKAIRKQVQILGQSIRSENGVQYASRLITSYVSGFEKF